MRPRTTPIQTTLKNGLKIIVVENLEATGTTCLLSYNVSRRNESADNAGINFALLTTLQTDNYDNTLNLNFSTCASDTYTLFKFSIKPEQLSQCFELNARMMSTPKLTKSTLQRTIDAHLNDRANKRHFTSDDSIPAEFDSLSHPIGNLYHPLVTPHSAGRIDIAHVKQWHQQFYAPGNACLIVTGNVKAKEVQRLAQHYFNTVLHRPEASTQDVQQIDELDKHHYVLHKATWKPRLLVVINTPKMHDGIANGSNAALYILSELIDQKLTHRLSASNGTTQYEPNKFASLFMVSVTASTRDQHLEAIEADFNTLIDELKFNSLPPEELKIARERVLARLTKSEDHKSVALEIGQLENFKIPFSYLDQRHEDLLNVTAKDVQHAAKTFFTPQRTTVVHILPMQAPIRPTPVVLTLDNGLKIITQENPQAERIVCSLNYKVSSRDETADNAGINRVLNNVLVEGDSFVEIEDFDVWHLSDFTQYSHITTLDNLNDNFKGLAKIMGAPTLTEKDIKKGIATELQLEEKNRFFTTDYSTPEAFDRLNYPISGYGNGSITSASAAHIDLKQVLEWHQHYYSPANACLVIVGNVKAQEIEKLAKQHFGAVPFRSTAPAKHVKELHEPGERRMTLRMDTETPRLLVAFNTQGMIGGAADKSAAALHIISLLFEQNYKASLPVSRGVCSFTQKKHAGLFRVSVTASNFDQSLEELEAALIELISQFKSNGVPLEAVEMAREQALANLVGREGNDGKMAYDLVQLENNQMPFTHIKQRQIDLEEVTLEEICRVATIYFTPQRMTVAHISPMQIARH